MEEKPGPPEDIFRRINLIFRCAFERLLTTPVLCLGEMTVFAPISGGYLHFCERFLHPSLGFGLAYLQIFASVCPHHVAPQP